MDVDDTWYVTDRTTGQRRASTQHGKGARWQARWRDPAGKQRSKRFAKKSDAERWLSKMRVDMAVGSYVAPELARLTVGEWCEKWLEGYGSRRASTVREARTHIAQIVAEFGRTQVAAVRPSHVKSWTARLREQGHAESYVYALHARLAQIMADAVADGLRARSPCSRSTSPGVSRQRPYVASTEQVWALHDAMPARLRVAILLGAFVGLRVAEACGLRVADVDFMRGVVHPDVQYPAAPLKTSTSRTPVPIPAELAAELSAQVAQWPAETLLTNRYGGQLAPWALERPFRRARTAVDGLPTGFRYQDLRHYLASMLIAAGADVKVVQERMRHASAKTTLDVYGHLWPGSDESTRSAVRAAMVRRNSCAQNVHTERGQM